MEGCETAEQDVSRFLKSCFAPQKQKKKKENAKNDRDQKLNATAAENRKKIEEHNATVLYFCLSV